LNRFSSDLNVVDEELQQTISQLSNSVAACLGAIGGIAGSTKGTFLILLVPLIFLYFKFQQFFRAGNTTVARLESVSRSPIYADFSQALIGANSIRAYMQQTRFVTSLNKALNHNSIANITQQLSSQWLAIRLDFLG
jgi:ABC-type multidrug transport system fused ATPase/permease subunit